MKQSTSSLWAADSREQKWRGERVRRSSAVKTLSSGSWESRGRRLPRFPCHTEVFVHLRQFLFWGSFVLLLLLWRGCDCPCSRGWAGCQGSPARGLSLGWPSVTPAGQLGFRSSQLFSGAEKNAWFKLTPRSSHFHSIPFRIQIHDQPQISVCLEAKNNMKCIKHAMQKLQLETSTAICPWF